MTATSWTYVYVVYRVDAFARQDSVPATDTNEQITIKEVFPTREQAEAEVARLNTLSEGKEWRYYYQSARFYARGRD